MYVKQLDALFRLFYDVFREPVIFQIMWNEVTFSQKLLKVK